MPQTNTFDSFITQVDYSLMDSLNADQKQQILATTINHVKYSRGTTFQSNPLHYPIQSTSPTANVCLKIWGWMTNSHRTINLAVCSPVISPQPKIRCVHMGGQQGMPYPSTELNTHSNVLFEREMVMAMDAPCQSLKVYSKVNAGKCN